MAATLNDALSLDDWIALVLTCGKINFRTMELLDAAHTGAYGHPEPTRIPLGTRKGKAILVSGHDLRDMEELLKQTEGRNITVYTPGRCCRATGIRHSKTSLIFTDITARPGRIRQRNWPNFRVPSS